MENIQSFVNENFGTIRTMLINDEPYFVGKDVASILGYTNPRKAIIDHVDEEDKTDGVTIRDSIGRAQNPVCINESGLYSLILSSKLPTAKKFKRWVTTEVLPTIRKHGMYANEETIEKMLADPDSMIKILTELKKEREQRIKLENENAALLPDANMARDIIKYDGMYTLKEVSDLIETGRTTLCSLLRTSGVLSKQTGYNLPLNKFIKSGHFAVKIKEMSNTPVTLITPKGLKYIYKLIKKYDLEDEFNVEALNVA